MDGFTFNTNLDTLGKTTFGVMLLEFVPSGQCFMLRSKSLRETYNSYMSWLRRGVVENKDLQRVYNNSTGIKLLWTSPPTLTDAVMIQKRWMEIHGDKLLNKLTKFGLTLGTISKIKPFEEDTVSYTLNEFVLADVKTSTTCGSDGSTLASPAEIAFQSGNRKCSIVSFSLDKPVFLPSIGCAVYLLRGPSGEVYIGSTRSPNERVTTHMSHLRNNRHRNKRVTELYKQVGPRGFEFIIAIFDGQETSDSIKDLEQELIDHVRETNPSQLLNTSLDAKLFGKGLVVDDRGRHLRSQRFSKQVCIKGTVYSSLTQASDSLGVPLTNLWKLVNGADPEYKYV